MLAAALLPPRSPPLPEPHRLIFKQLTVPYWEMAGFKEGFVAKVAEPLAAAMVDLHLDLLAVLRPRQGKKRGVFCASVACMCWSSFMLLFWNKPCCTAPAARPSSTTCSAFGRWQPSREACSGLSQPSRKMSPTCGGFGWKAWVAASSEHASPRTHTGTRHAAPVLQMVLLWHHECSRAYADRLVRKGGRGMTLRTWTDVPCRERRAWRGHSQLGLATPENSFGPMPYARQAPPNPGPIPSPCLRSCTHSSPPPPGLCR